MFKTFINALKVKDVRSRLLFTLLCLLIVRIGCQIPVPGINRGLFESWLASVTQGLGFLSMLTGGSFEKQSIFSLNITPYITSSIIMQLLTIAIPRLEEMQKDGETGRKKIAEYTRYVTIGLAVFESVAMGIGFNNSGFLTGTPVVTIAIITVAFTAGSAFLMWLGEQITEKGIGNGISVILLINIVSGLPEDYGNLVEMFVTRDDLKFVNSVINAIIIIAITLVLIVLVILLQDAQRKISVQYAKKMQGRKMVGGQSSFIPLRVNTAGVIPVIFAGSLMQTPIIIASLFGVTGAVGQGTGRWILAFLDQNFWCSTEDGYGLLSLGLVLYLGLLIFFAYFYTAITFNPAEVANNLKKQGGFIPGIRPGRPTTDYLNKVLKYIILIGACGLAIVALIPIVFGGLFKAKVGFGGTSIIIIVGVILEMMTQIESMMRERHYKGFLSEE